MNGPVNSSSGRLNQAIVNSILEKTRDPDMQPQVIMEKANQAFTKVAAKYASEDAENKQQPGAWQSDPNAPELEKPDQNAVRQALQEAAQREKKNEVAGKTQTGQGQEAKRAEDQPQSAKTQTGQGQEAKGAGDQPRSSSFKDSSTQQQQTGMTRDNTSDAAQGDVATRGQSQTLSKAQTQQFSDARQSSNAKNPTRLMNDTGGSVSENMADSADTADNNQLTKFVSSNVKNQGQSENARTNSQPKPKAALLQDPAAKENKLATDAQSAATVMQANKNSAVDELEETTETQQAFSDSDTGSSIPLSNKAAMGLLFAQVMDIINKNSIQNMLGNMNALLAADQTASDDFQQQADAIGGMEAKNKELQDKVTDANKQLYTLEQLSEKANERAEKAAAAAAANPNDANLQAQAKAAAQEAETAKSAVTAQQEIVKGLNGQLAGSFKTIADAQKKFHDDLSAYNTQHNNQLTAQMQPNNYTSAAQMALVMAQFMAIMDKNSLDELNAAMEKNKLIREAQIADDQKKLAEAAEQKRKADTMGCISKLIGALITVVSFAAAIFTGGASLVLASIGLALLIADTVLEKTGNQTITGLFMEKVMKPFLDLMTKIAKEIIRSQLPPGTPDPPWLDTASAILGTIIAAIVIIVLVAAGMKAGGALLGKMAASQAGQSVAKVASQAGQWASNAAPALVNGFKAAQVSGATLKNLQIATKVTQASGAVGVAGVNTAGSIYNAQFEKNVADLSFGERMLTATAAMTQIDIELRKGIKKMMTDVMEQMTTVIEGKQELGKTILSNRPIAS